METSRGLAKLFFCLLFQVSCIVFPSGQEVSCVTVFSSCSNIKGWTREFLSEDQGVGSSYPPPARTGIRLHCQGETTHTLLNNSDIMHTAPSIWPFQLRDELKDSPGWDPGFPGCRRDRRFAGCKFLGFRGFDWSFPLILSLPKRYQTETVPLLVSMKESALHLVGKPAVTDDAGLIPSSRSTSLGAGCVT